MGKNSWYWVFNGENIDFKGRWLDNEPNNRDNREHCLCIGKRAEGVGFNDIECFGVEMSGFICQDSKKTKRNGIDLRIGA